jgi:arylesterase / paraoxonase
MRKLSLLLGLPVVLMAGYFLYLAHAAGEFREVNNLHPGQCRAIRGVAGPEDITLHPERDLALISSFDRRAARAGNPRPGAIYAWSLDGAMEAPFNLTPDAGLDFRPHGISLHVDADGRASLFVVNHPGEALFGPPPDAAGPAHTIEVFDYQVGPAGEAGQLRHRRTHAHPSMIRPNDVVAVDHERFYFTNDHGSAPGLLRSLEDYLRLGWANVVYFDGEGFEEAAAGLSWANGINRSPDGKRLYVAEVTHGRIREYARSAETGALEEIRRLDVGFGVDNIEVDPATGDLWLGGHVKLLTFSRHAGNADVLAPSQAVRVRRVGTPEIEIVFLDDGRLISGASVAAARDEVLLIGSVFETHMVECARPEKTFGARQPFRPSRARSG